MRLSYRTTTALALTTFVLLLSGESLFNPSRVPVPEAAAEVGVVRSDPCMMWEQIPATVRLSAFVWFGSFLVLLVQGLRNRPVPRWLAIVCLIALVPSVNHELWRVQRCYTTLNAVAFWIWISAVAVMCLHQVVQRPLRVRMA